MDVKEMTIIMINWINSSQDKDYWEVFVDTALNLRVS